MCTSAPSRLRQKTCSMNASVEPLCVVARLLGAAVPSHAADAGRSLVVEARKTNAQ